MRDIYHILGTSRDKSLEEMICLNSDYRLLVEDIRAGDIGRIVAPSPDRLFLSEHLQDEFWTLCQEHGVELSTSQTEGP